MTGIEICFNNIKRNINLLPDREKEFQAMILMNLDLFRERVDQFLIKKYNFFKNRENKEGYIEEFMEIVDIIYFAKANNIISEEDIFWKKLLYMDLFKMEETVQLFWIIF